VLARACSIGSEGPVDPVQSISWASQALAKSLRPWNYHLLGLAQYRAGQFDRALLNLMKAIDESWRYHEMGWFGLALVHHRLGHAEQARSCLEKGSPWLARQGPVRPDQPAKLLPQDWLEAQLLRREAEELLAIPRSP